MAQRSLQPDPATSTLGWWGNVSTAVRNWVLPASGDVQGRGRSRRTSSGVVARLVSRVLFIVALALLLVALGVFIFRAVYSDRIYPAIAVGDVNVGGMTVDEAAAAVEARAVELEHGTIAFTFNGQTWTPSLSEIGASVDVESSVDAAYDLGREDNAVSRLGFANQILKDDQSVPLRSTINPAVLDQWFDSVDADLNDPAVDARLVVEGGAVTVVPEESGTVVDREAATAFILDSLSALEPSEAELPTTVAHPLVASSDLEDARAQLERSMAAPFVVTFEGRQWEIAPTDLAQFLTIDVKSNDGVKVELTMDTERLSEFLRERFAGEINRPPADARIGWREGEGLLALEPSTDGAALRSSAFAELVSEGFLSASGPVEVPVVVTKPEIDSNNLEALKINSRLARGDSNYGGQRWQRDENIEVATNYLTGTLVRPGEEFSFNEAIGVINKERGFVESGVIVNGRASTGDGGGVCQVSTTVFRATILAGLPITDWAEHTQRLPIYEQDGWTAGFDASILQWEGGDPSEWGDFRFLNDTGGYLLIQSWTDYPYHIVEIYGNDDGRQVEVSDATVWTATEYPDDLEVVDETKPAGFMEQTEWPRLPAEAVFTVTVTYADGTVREQEFYSVYHGNGNVWTVSPDMQGRSPAAT